MMPVQHGGPPIATATATPYNDLEAGGLNIAKGTPVYEHCAAVRAGFIRKVYGLLSMQLLCTVLASAFFMFHEPTREWVLASTSLFYVTMFAPLLFLCALFSFKDKHPTNLFLLGGFTLCESYTVGFVCAMYYQSGYGLVVLQALMLTAAVFVSLTTYVLVTKKDFSFLGAGLSAGLMVLLMWGLLQLFFPVGNGGRMIFALLGALLFAGYILYDTSAIIHRLGPDDYIVAAIDLYLDIINLFLYLLEFLRMFSGGND